MTGTNTGAPPSVAISSPTNGTVLSNFVTVVVSASAPNFLSDVLLFVDGQQMSQSLDGTNFVINTCEWANGTHTLFAVAKSQSQISVSPYGGNITYGRAVSAFVTVTFNNLIEQLAFSQPFFQPALGQTQQVTASFAADVNWSLQIQDVNSNTVASASGVGTSMLYDWDGTSNGVAIPDGIFTYLVSAQTNGGTQPQVTSPGGGSGGPPTMNVENGAFDDGSNSGVVVLPLPPAPPGFSYGTDENGNEITNITVTIPREQSYSASGVLRADGASPDGSSDGNDPPAPPPSQATQGPNRPPTAGVKGSNGTFGVVYFTFPSPTGQVTFNAPTTGFPFSPYFVALNGGQASPRVSFPSLPPAEAEAKKFAEYMTKQGWKQTFMLTDGQVTANDLKKASLGGRSLFNTVNIGLLITHGAYGSSYESDFVYYSYVWFPDGSYLRLSDFDFGSPGTNGLHWMNVHACGVLNQRCYNSMSNRGKLPVNGNLNLLLGCSTTTYMEGPLGLGYAFGLTGINGKNQMTLPNAWFYAGTNAYNNLHTNTPVNFTIVGSDNCFGDSVSSFQQSPSGNLQYLDQNVYTPH